MWRDSVREQDLEDAEFQDVREAALQPLHGASRDLLECRIQRAPPLHRSEGEVHRE